MSKIGALGLGDSLDRAGLAIGGWGEASLTYNIDHPGDHRNTLRVFDFEDEDFTLNQVGVFIERVIGASPDQFDVGGRVEWLYGGDARVIHANGLFDHSGFPAFPGSPGTGDGPDEQFDLVQAYATLNVPVGNGLLIKAGKFVTLHGYETINPTTNPLYSHTYLFGYAIPFTHTGVLTTYAIDKNLSFTGGIVRGWEQALEDNNDAISFYGQGAYASQKFDFTVNVVSGPEQVDDGSDYRTVIDVIAVYRQNENLSWVLNADYGWEPGAAAGGGDASWYGAAGYALYKIDDRFSLVGRAEYFNDVDGSRGIGAHVIALTAGVNIRPMPDEPYGNGLMIRPEVRWDHADRNLFNGGNDDNELTFGVDVIYAF